MKPQTLLLIVAASLLASCASVPTMQAGAESVRITSLQDQVRNVQTLDSETFRVGEMVVRKDEVITRLAKNFTHSRGGDLAFIQSKWQETDRWLLLPFTSTYAKVVAYRTNSTDS